MSDATYNILKAKYHPDAPVAQQDPVLKLLVEKTYEQLLAEYNAMLAAEEAAKPWHQQLVERTRAANTKRNQQ